MIFAEAEEAYIGAQGLRSSMTDSTHGRCITDPGSSNEG